MQSSRRRLMIFSIAAGGIFLLITAAVLIFVTSGVKKEIPQEKKVETVKTVPETLPKEEKITPLEEVKVPEKKAETKLEKKQPPKPAIVLSEKEQFDFYASFLSGKSAVALPKSLHDADEIIVVLKNKWKSLPEISDISKCIERKGKKEIIVYAVKKMKTIITALIRATYLLCRSLWAEMS